MKYKVLIKKCEDAVVGSKIAEEISRWSGSPVDVVRNAISQKSVCIRKEADEAEAMQLKQKFESLGGIIELVALDAVVTPLPSVAAAATVVKKHPVAKVEADDEDEEAPGRQLSEQEFIAVLAKRPDIFYMAKETTLRNLAIACLVIGLGLGIVMNNVSMAGKTNDDFFNRLPEEVTGKIVTEIIDPSLVKKEEKKKEEEKKAEEIKDEKKTMEKAVASKGSGGKHGGGGDPRSRVTKQGVLGIISGKVKGKAVAGADIFGKGGFASDIDAVLQGVGGLRAGGGGGVGRKGAAGIGFGTGYGSGFGGGSGGVDDIIGSLLPSSGGSLGLKASAKKDIKISVPTTLTGGALTGGRSQASIMRVVMQNLGALKYAYSKRLRENPQLQGKIKVKFAIDEFGKVVFCNVLESTMNDKTLEDEIVSKIKRWAFDKIDKPGDITEVVYPFVFSP